ncbi:O-antigen ligase family protein [Reinekea sp.]|jgi:O-antigen ligase|uniref:O-antigen ligase family protein n=1 Tax=Reinekea sp. TaxID=1970455 RepID=UPI002A8257C4|nr:O-antigen ligase family protein [Reinekea sp.]
MLKTLRLDLTGLISAFRGQDPIFYLGCCYIVLNYLRPQLIYPYLNILPWTQIVILVGLSLMFLRGQLKFNTTQFMVFLFALLATLSALNSQYPYISGRSITTPMIFAVEVLFLSNCSKSSKQTMLLFSLLFVCLFKMSFFGARIWATRGFGFTSWGIQGPPGFFQNSGEYSLLMAITAVMSIPFILSLAIKRKYFWLLPITASMTVMGASSRGGQLALVVGALYLLIAYKKLKFKNILYVVALSWLIMVVMPEEQKVRFSTMGKDDTSASRFQYWKAGFEMARDFPLLGVGLNAFPEYYHNHYKVLDGSYLASRKEVSHNSLVQVASTLGFPSLFLYLILHIRIFFTGILRRRDPFMFDKVTIHYIRALRAAILTYLIGSMFMSVAFYPYIYLLLGLSGVVFTSANNTIKGTYEFSK